MLSVQNRCRRLKTGHTIDPERPEGAQRGSTSDTGDNLVCLQGNAVLPPSSQRFVVSFGLVPIGEQGINNLM